METLLFLVVAVVLYFVSDRLLLLIESWAGRTFENRTVYFFLILLALALLSFALIRQISA